MIEFSKKVNGVYYAVQAIPNSKAKSMYIVSAYMKKGENTNLGPGMPNNGLRQTPEACQGLSVFTTYNTIPQNVSGVNEKRGTQIRSVQALLPEISKLSVERGYPRRVDGAVYKVIEIPKSKIDEISAYIDGLSNATVKKNYKRILKNLFMGQSFKNVNTVVNDLNYEIGIGSKGIGEIIAHQPVNENTLAMLKQLDEIVENAKYVASEPSNKMSPKILRTDRFETQTKTGEQSGLAKMRINVTPEGKNYISLHMK